MITIIFESHGTTFDNEQKLSSGHFDVGLSPLGESQAAELGRRREAEKIDAIFCSDLIRAVRTAEIAFAGRAIIKDPRLRECDYGRLNHHPTAEVEPKKIEFVKTPFPGGESYEQCAGRMKFFLEDLSRDYAGKTVVIIGHRATQYALELWINKIPLNQSVGAPWQWQPGWIYKFEKL